MNNLLTPVQTKGTLVHGIVSFNQFNGHESDINVVYQVGLIDEDEKYTVIAEQTQYLPYHQVGTILEAPITSEDIDKNYKEITIKRLTKYMADNDLIKIV